MRKPLLFVHGFSKGVKDFSENITTFVNFFLLSFVYLFGVGITAIIAKLIKKDFLDKKLHSKSSYWYKMDINKKTDGYFKQF